MPWACRKFHSDSFDVFDDGYMNKLAIVCCWFLRWRQGKFWEELAEKQRQLYNRKLEKAWKCFSLSCRAVSLCSPIRSSFTGQQVLANLC